MLLMKESLQVSARHFRALRKVFWSRPLHWCRAFCFLQSRFRLRIAVFRCWYYGWWWGGILHIPSGARKFPLICSWRCSCRCGAEAVMPLMALIYIGATLTILIVHIEKLPETLMLILNDAFTWKAAGGGIVGAFVAGLRSLAFSTSSLSPVHS